MRPAAKWGVLALFAALCADSRAEVQMPPQPPGHVVDLAAVIPPDRIPVGRRKSVRQENQVVDANTRISPWSTSDPAFPLFIGVVSCLGVIFRSRYKLGLEILALRQQLGVLRRKHPQPDSTIGCFRFSFA